MNTYPVWWETGTRDANGRPIAEVIAVLPYMGPFREAFNAVLRLRAPNTNRGYLEMAVKI